MARDVDQVHREVVGVDPAVAEEVAAELRRRLEPPARPEDVRLIPDGNTNVIEARVLAQVYMGTYTQVQLDVQGHKWLAHGPADFRTQVGGTIRIQLPKSRIWLLPAE